jgi:hypothetical protein
MPARHSLLDDWIDVQIVAQRTQLMTLAYVLKRAAEQTRSRALERMNADLRWLSGSFDGKLVQPFERLVKAVEGERRGAFAPFFEQPLLTAILVPLGGAGGVQLFDYLLLGR